MLRNTKAHIDPICVIPTTLLVIMGVIILSWALAGDKIWMPAVLIFSMLVIISPLVHLFHHGLTPISGVMGALMLLVGIFMLRFAVGNADPVGSFYFDNLTTIIPIVIALDVLKMVSP
ncbi:MAG: hypothetical protein ABIG20_02710 [archaeon]